LNTLTFWKTPYRARNPMKKRFLW